MSNPAFSWERFYKIPVVGILRNVSFEELKQILALYEEAGLSTIEITFNTPGAEELLHYAAAHYGDRLNIGAGTVCRMDELDAALGAGARFIVTPVLTEPVIEACVEQKIPVFPGAYTPTEIYRAWSLGASMVKVFPATSLGPGYIKEVLAPLNGIRLMPTGGVSTGNFREFLRAGAAGLGMGSQLFPKAYIREKNWEALKQHFDEFVKRINASIP